MLISEADLQQLIADGVEESLTLDYKAAAALAKNDAKRAEVTKDVSAMANAAGGRIIYGMREGTDPASRHRPEAIDPVDRRAISKEWLDQVIGSVRPRVDGVVITPVPLASAADHVAYVVDIPQGVTAHQAADKRYYRRYNFESVAMYDHEIRDVMARNQHPQLSLALQVTIETLEVQAGFGFGLPGERTRRDDVYRLGVWVHNTGARFAQFVNGFVSLPEAIVAEGERRLGSREMVGGKPHLTFGFDNTRRDVVGTEKNPLGARPIYGPSWFSPLLPGLGRELLSVELDGLRYLATKAHTAVPWSVHADNAPPAEGQIALAAVPEDDQRG